MECDLTFKLEEGALKHFNTKHRQEKGLINYAIFAKIASDENRLTCGQCRMKFQWPNLLFKHFKTAHNEIFDANLLNCTICNDFQADNQEAIESHMTYDHQLGLKGI